MPLFAPVDQLCPQTRQFLGISARPLRQYRPRIGGFQGKAAARASHTLLAALRFNIPIFHVPIARRLARGAGPWWAHATSGTSVVCKYACEVYL